MPRTRLACLLAAVALALTGCATGAEPGPTPSAGPGQGPSEPTSSASPGATTGPTPTSSGATALTLTIDETGSGPERSLTLTCDPVGGDHPQAEAACAALAGLGAGAFDDPPADVLCTQQWGGPQVATVEGTVDGTPVTARLARTDGCEIARWDALVPLLPAAGGGL